MLMSFPLLISPSMMSFLDAFESRPDLGLIRVPIITQSPSSPPLMKIVQEPLSQSNVGTFVRTIRSLLGEAQAMDHYDPCDPLRFGRWFMDYPAGRVYFYRDEYISVFVSGRSQDASRIEVATGVNVWEWAAAIMSVMIDDGKGRTKMAAPTYEVHFDGIGLLSLRTFLGLSMTAPLDLIFQGVCETLGLGLSPSEQRTIRRWGPSSKDLAVTKRLNHHLCRIKAGFVREDRTPSEEFMERFTVKINSRTVGKAALPASVLRLWNFVDQGLSDEEGLPDEMLETSVAEYLELTRKIYRNPSP